MSRAQDALQLRVHVSTVGSHTAHAHVILFSKQETMPRRRPRHATQSLVPSLLSGPAGRPSLGPLASALWRHLGLGLKEVKSRSKLRSRSEDAAREKPGGQHKEGPSNSIYSACGTRASSSHISALVLQVREVDHFLREDEQAQPAARVGLVVDRSRVRHDLLPFVH